MIESIPIATLVIDPRYDWLLIWNFVISIIGLITLNFSKKIDSFLMGSNFKLTSWNIMEILFRMLILLNVAFFLFQYFTEDLFYFQKRLVNYSG